MQTQKEKETKEYMLGILDEYFNRGVDRKKFIDVNRIPLICQDINSMHKSIEKIEDNMTWIVRLILGAIILAVIAMIIKK